MKEYLGFKYRIEDSGLAIMTEEPGIFCDEQSLKDVVLQNRYKPVKTLKWLEEMTDYEWFYNDRTINCEINDCVYFLDDGICYIDKNGYLIIEEGIVESFEAELTPREFVEKIARGEWI